MGAVLTILANCTFSVFKGIAKFGDWFYFTCLPYVLNYIGIPFFLLGLLLAVGFIFGNLLFFLLMTILGYYFIKQLLFVAPTTKKIKGVVSSNITAQNIATTSVQNLTPNIKIPI